MDYQFFTYIMTGMGLYGEYQSRNMGFILPLRGKDRYYSKLVHEYESGMPVAD
ncbi:MAG: hypothetical protein LBU94_03390 [Clostridiales bacterium]|jgi:hypothetical protein|nr:hypothetical protein [Clostridiales bacterium]